ncbi:DUF1566 domain-containing protein [Desulfococcaceae bacterium HSG7]|nr:DUF1566 domain-containing protein [Desulfococcaceae bacterium HSG7]
MIKPDTIVALQKNQYRIIKKIGFGAYGVVWRAERISDGVMVGVKTIQTRSPENRSPFSKSFLAKIIEVQKKEIEFLRRLTPEIAMQNHILPLIDFGQSDDAPVMVLPLCDRSLAEVYEQRTETSFPFDGVTLVRWIGQIAAALKTVHALGGKPGEPGKFSHRDLKLQNVLVKDNNLYLSDYGTVKRIGHHLTFSLAGTPNWGAPEMLLPKKIDKGEPIYKFDESADLYPLGLLIHALVTGNYTSAQGDVVHLLSMSGKPLAGAEKKFGQIGGLTGREQQTLKSDMHRLFIDEDKTIISESDRSLPDLEQIVAQLSTLVENLLASKAKQRLTAKQVHQCANHMLEMLNPVLDALNIEILHKVKSGRPYLLHINAKGRGLPPDGRWLIITLAGKTTEPRRIKKIADNTWKVKLAPLPKSGNYNIKAYALVNNRKIESDEDLTICLAEIKKAPMIRRLLAVLLIIGLLATDAGIFYLMGVRFNGKELIITLKKANQANKDKIEKLQEIHKTNESLISTLQRKIKDKDARSVSLLKLLKAQKKQLAVLGQGKSQEDEQLVALLKEKQTLQIANEQLAEELRTLRDPEKQKAKQIAALLKASAKYLQNDYLINPPGTNAYETNLQVLKLDPGNDKALKSLKQIAFQCYAKANRSYKSNDNDKAAKFIEGGLSVAPEHKELLDLKQKIEGRKNVEIPNPTSVAPSRPKVTHSRQSNPRTVSSDEFKAVFKLDKYRRPKQYVPVTSTRFQKIKNGQVVKDAATGLVWQQPRSSNYMKYNDALQYIKRLNRDNFAGYNDWRLPTVDELTSLLTKTKRNGNIYIHTIFDKMQRWCWSSNKRTSGGAWTVRFTYGDVYWNLLDDDAYVRGVRAGK